MQGTCDKTKHNLRICTIIMKVGCKEHAFTPGPGRAGVIVLADKLSVACRASACKPVGNAPCTSRRKAHFALTSLVFTAKGSIAAGIEAIPQAEKAESLTDLQKKNQQLFDKGSEAFENSDLLRTLRERTDANKEKNRKALQDRYCYRQAELGVGDCAGLRLIPGATKSGKQKTPEWLKGILEKLGQLPPEEKAASGAAKSN